MVTGKKKKSGLKPRNVFQEYNFSFNSDSIKFIVENVNADVVIFGGEINRLSDYLAGVTNIILSLKDSCVEQLIYVSSLRVFSGNNEEKIDEMTTPNPKRDLEQTILMGERICRSYDSERRFKVNIVRFSDLYGSYNDLYLKNNICAEVCRKFLNDDDIQIIKNKEHNLIYIDDAVDSIYKVMNSEGRSYEIYHVASTGDEIYSEEQVINVFKSNVDFKNNVEIIEIEDDISNKIYDTEKIRALNFSVKYRLKDKIDELYETIRKSMKDREYLKTERVSIFSIIFNTEGKIKNRIFPFIENLLFFILLSLIIYLTRGMEFYKAIDVYLIYVVIIGVIYGYEQALFAVVLSVISNLYLTFKLGTEGIGLPSYYIYLWILQLFTIGILVGYIKEQYKIKFSDMKEENHQLDTQLTSIKDINRSNEEIKDLYERRLLNYKDSFGRIYEIVSELDMIEPQGIIFKSISVIGKVMDTKDVSIYIYSGNSEFFRLMASSSQKTRNLMHSLKVSEYSHMFSKLLNNKLYINSDLDPRYPIMAGGTYKEGKLQTIIMIWTLPFENNNLYQMNVFGIVCKLIERSLNVGYEYVESISVNTNRKNDNIIDKASFKKVVELYKAGAEDDIVDFFLVKVRKNDKMKKEEFHEILKESIRETDFIGENEENIMCVLLTNTNKEQSIHAINRLEKNGIEVIEGDRIANCG